MIVANCNELCFYRGDIAVRTSPKVRPCCFQIKVNSAASEKQDPPYTKLSPPSLLSNLFDDTGN